MIPWEIAGDEWHGFWLVNSVGEQVTPVYSERDVAEEYLKRLVFTLRTMGG